MQQKGRKLDTCIYSLLCRQSSQISAATDLLFYFFQKNSTTIAKEQRVKWKQDMITIKSRCVFFTLSYISHTKNAIRNIQGGAAGSNSNSERKCPFILLNILPKE